jgi:N6-adenosine-specific RNA methylase IME4
MTPFFEKRASRASRASFSHEANDADDADDARFSLVRESDQTPMTFLDDLFIRSLPTDAFTCHAPHQSDDWLLYCKQKPPKSVDLRPSDIRVGRRFRKDIGNITEFADNIANNVGLLLQPIVVRRVKGQWWLVTGARRLEAAKLLGWKTVPVIAHYNMDDATARRAEASENVDRKNFTPSEAVTAKRALEPIEEAAAKARQREHGKTAPGRKHSGQVAHSDKGRAADKAAKGTGMSRRTLEKAEAIVDAAKANPKKYGKLLEAMDRTGRVNGLFKRLKIIKQADKIRKEPPPLPGRGPYRVIVADSPWPYEIRREDASHRANTSYPLMSIAQICAMRVQDIAAPDCILWLWTTNLHMRNAFVVLDAWGFEPKTILTWAKDKKGTGDWLRGQTEHCIMASRGKPPLMLTKQSTLLQAPTRGHSVKPREFYDLVESLCPAPRYADIFSRHRHNDKWDCHGDEAPRVSKYPQHKQMKGNDHD